MLVKNKLASNLCVDFKVKSEGLQEKNSQTKELRVLCESSIPIETERQ